MTKTPQWEKNLRQARADNLVIVKADVWAMMDALDAARQEMADARRLAFEQAEQACGEIKARYANESCGMASQYQADVASECMEAIRALKEQG